MQWDLIKDSTPHHELAVGITLEPSLGQAQGRQEVSDSMAHLVRKVIPQRPHHGLVVGVGEAEEGVEVGQEGVAHADGLPHPVCRGLVVQPGLPTLGLKVGVAPEERVEGPQLVPSREELCIWIAKEPCNVSSCTAHRIRSPSLENEIEVSADIGHHRVTNVEPLKHEWVL